MPRLIYEGEIILIEEATEEWYHVLLWCHFYLLGIEKVQHRLYHQGGGVLIPVPSETYYYFI